MKKPGPRLKLQPTEHRLNRMLDAFEKEFVMWSWRKRGASIYELIRDEMQMPGGVLGNVRQMMRAAPDLKITVIPMLGKVSHDQDARRIFCGMRNRAAMARALEAL